MNNKRLMTMATAALLVAMEIVLSRFLSINTPLVKIGFGFLPVALAGFLFGPIWGAAVGAMADFLGAMLFPIGPYFLGFTVTAAVAGFIYGLFLHKKTELMLPRVIIAAGIICVPLHLGLNSLWVYILYGTSFGTLVITRAAQCLIMMPIQVVLLWIIASRMQAYVKKHAET